MGRKGSRTMGSKGSRTRGSKGSSKGSRTVGIEGSRRRSRTNGHCTCLICLRMISVCSHLYDLSSDRLPNMEVTAGVRNKQVCQLCEACSASQLPQEAHVTSIVGDVCDVAGHKQGFLHV